ncbi:MAG: hypothetical protein ACP5EP_11285 [Acidobacteriaceae bacterium]
MPIQSELFPSNAPAPLPPPPAAQPGPRRDGGPPVPVWMQRFSLVVMVTVCLYVGLLLGCLPWTRFWQENHFLMAYPWMGRLLLNGAARGVVSGMGLLDLWIGISEALHYRDHRA